MKMKKCYIAGKIGDLPVEVFTGNFEYAEAEVELMGMIPVSPLKLPHTHNKSWNEHMKEDLIAMLQCDCVYAMRNFRFSPGACIEIELAVKVGINIIHQ
jgi:hypothetical protein